MTGEQWCSQENWILRPLACLSAQPRKVSVNLDLSDIELRDDVDDQTARQRLHDERHRVQELLNQSAANGWDERLGANEQGDMSDSAEPLIAEQEDSAIAAGLRERLDAIKRAEQRLSDRTYGRSVRSGQPIPDDRLEADPAAELTVDEAQED